MSGTPTQLAVEIHNEGVVVLSQGGVSQKDDHEVGGAGGDDQTITEKGGGEGGVEKGTQSTSRDSK
eukprot:14453178-Ditylum_brightwellii.AAC.1